MRDQWDSFVTGIKGWPRWLRWTVAGILVVAVIAGATSDSSTDKGGDESSATHATPVEQSTTTPSHTQTEPEPEPKPEPTPPAKEEPESEPDSMADLSDDEKVDLMAAAIGTDKFCKAYAEALSSGLGDDFAYGNFLRGYQAGPDIPDAPPAHEVYEELKDRC